MHIDTPDRMEYGVGGGERKRKQNLNTKGEMPTEKEKKTGALRNVGS